MYIYIYILWAPQPHWPVPGFLNRTVQPQRRLQLCQAPPRQTTACRQSSCFRSTVRGFPWEMGLLKLYVAWWPGYAWFVLHWTGS